MPIRNMPSTTVLLTTLVVAGWQLSVVAQSLPSTFLDFKTSLWHGETLSVTDRSGTEMKGRVLKITDDAITLSLHGQPHTFNEPDVASITRRRTHAGRGALIGLALGGGVGVLAGLSGTADKGWALVLGAMFGGIAGGIGAGVGAAIHSDEILYRSLKAPTSLLRAPDSATRTVTQSGDTIALIAPTAAQ